MEFYVNFSVELWEMRYLGLEFWGGSKIEWMGDDGWSVWKWMLMGFGWIFNFCKLYVFSF